MKKRMRRQMLEKIMNLLKEKPRSARCFWKVIYDNYVISKIYPYKLDEFYRKQMEKCKECDGYSVKKACHYTRK